MPHAKTQDRKNLKKEKKKKQRDHKDIKQSYTKHKIEIRTK
jgi:hypothetical protein